MDELDPNAPFCANCKFWTERKDRPNFGTCGNPDNKKIFIGFQRGKPYTRWSNLCKEFERK